MIPRWLAPLLVGISAACILAALMVEHDAVLYLIGVAVAAAFAAPVVAYLATNEPGSP